MCFSATASFGAAAALGTIGTVSVIKAGTPSRLPFALIPLLFGLQQVSEGVLWLSLTHQNLYDWKIPATYFFLFFAQFFWTWWIPFSVYRMEEDPGRQKWLFGLFFIGLCCSTMLGYRLILYGSFAGIEQNHIYYDIGSTEVLTVLSSTCYVIAIIVPFFVSSVPKMRWLACLLVVSLLATRFFYKAYFISVWCFFAALLSISIIYVLSVRRHKTTPGSPVPHSHGASRP